MEAFLHWSPIYEGISPWSPIYGGISPLTTGIRRPFSTDNQYLEASLHWLQTYEDISPLTTNIWCISHYRPWAAGIVFRRLAPTIHRSWLHGFAASYTKNKKNYLCFFVFCFFYCKTWTWPLTAAEKNKASCCVRLRGRVVSISGLDGQKHKLFYKIKWLWYV